MLRVIAPLILVACLMTTSGTALAQQASQLDEAARLTFISAREAFLAGNYEVALERFRQAYRLSPRPALLYNIAQSLDRLRRDAEAVEALQNYINAMPNAPNRGEVEARIRVLQRAVNEQRARDAATQQQVNEAQRRAQEAAAQAQAAQTVESRPPLHPAIFIATAGLALGTAGLIAWTGPETDSVNQQYLSVNPTYVNVTDAQRATAEVLYDEAMLYQTLTNVFIGVSAGLAVGAVVMALFTDWEAFGGGDAATATLPTFQFSPQGGSLGFVQSF